MVPLNQLIDYQNNSNFCIPMSILKYEVSLTAGAEKTLNVPTDATCCIISATGNFAVAGNVTAAMPGSASFTATNSSMNKPGIWLRSTDPNVQFTPITVLHFISKDAIDMIVEFY